MTGKQVDNYLNWQAEIKQLREENQRLLDHYKWLMSYIRDLLEVRGEEE